MQFYLNGYQPALQTSGQLVGFLVGHRGASIPSPALLGKMGEAFLKALADLKESQNQLLVSEKMAVLGGLVAGVGTALGIGALSKSGQVREDTAIGVIFAVLLGPAGGRAATGTGTAATTRLQARSARRPRRNRP